MAVSPPRCFQFRCWPVICPRAAPPKSIRWSLCDTNEEASAMNRLWHDFKYAARMLRTRPGFTAAAVLSLALGIGACTAIFSVVDAVLLRSLPYPAAERIVQLREVNAKGAQVPVAEPNYVDARARNHTLESVAQFGGALVTITGGSQPVRAPASTVSSEFFKVLGVQPAVG